MAGEIRGRPRAVVIAGATASGKSALAMDLAERLGGAVVNADSMQVYRELRILTARPSPEDEARAPHRLYGHVGAARPYSVAAWRADAERVLADLDAAGILPILTGGTGLYFMALLNGLSVVPDIPDDVRDPIRRFVEEAGPEAAHRRLARVDPAMAARLRPSDSQRIARALEVIEATGRSLAAWQANPPLPPILGTGDVRRIVLEIDRAELHRRIERRFDQMMAAGALAEVEALAALGLPETQPAMRAIGVGPLLAARRGEIGLDEAFARAKAETRQYAKRQETWFRHRMADWTRMPAG